MIYPSDKLSFTTRWPPIFPSFFIRTITMGRGPHPLHRPPLPPPCWSDKERGGCLFREARTKHPGAQRSAPQRMAATGLTSPAASVASPTMTATWSAVTSAGKLTRFSQLICDSERSPKLSLNFFKSQFEVASMLWRRKKMYSLIFLFFL